MGNSAPWRSQGKPFIPGRFWHSPTNVISSDDLMWKSQPWNEIRKHQDATGIFPSHFPRGGLMFSCWCRFHWIIWGRFPHEYQIFHYKSALSCSVINPSPTASLGSNMRAPKSLFQEKSALCQAPPSPPARCNIWGTAPLKAEFLGQNTQSEGYFGFVGVFFVKPTWNRKFNFKKAQPKCACVIFQGSDGWLNFMWSKAYKENRGISSAGEQRV